jgi:ABC-type glycerol-3-phosphate transport system permease component
LIRAYLQQLPDSIFDAAAVDGAGTTRLLRHVVVPLAVPSIATIATLVGILGLNDLLFASVMITGNSQTTGIVGIASLANQYNSQIPEVAAGLIIALLPIMVVFLVAQRALRRGITMGTDR